MSFPKSIRTAWVATSVAPQGTNTANLTPYQVGLFNENHVAFTSSTFQANRNIRFAVGSPNTGQKGVTGKLGNFPNINNVDISFKSQHVFGHNIDRVWVSKPVKTAKPFIGYIGFDDQSTDKNLLITPGKQYAIEVVVKGQPVRAIFGQDIRESFEIDGGCVGSATTLTGVNPTNGLAANENAAGLVINDLIRRLGDGYITSRFFKAEKVISGASYSATNALYAYTLTVSDTGDSLALAAVKNQFSSYTIERDNRIGNTSVYRLLNGSSTLVSGGTLSSFSQNNTYLFDCPTGTCASGYTVTPGYSLFNVTRARLTTDVFSGNYTDANSNALANFVGSSYHKPISFVASSAVNGTTEQITINNHGLTTGQAVIYLANTGNAIGLTDFTTYYVIRIDANTISLADSPALATAGTAKDLSAGTGTQYLSPVESVVTGITATNLNNITITKTAHGLKSGDVVYYAFGTGSATATGITAYTTPYIVTVVTADTFKLSTTFANYIAQTYVSPSAATGNTQAFVKIPTSVLMTVNADNYVVALKQAPNLTSITPVNADTIVYEGNIKMYCSLTSPITTSWVSAGIAYARATKIYTLTKKIDDCDGTNVATELAALKAAYPVSLTVSSAPAVASAAPFDGTGVNTCNVTYTMTVFSRPMDLDCDTIPTPIFDTPAAWKGFQWVGGAETPSALVGENETTSKYGIKFTGAFVDQRTGGCSFDPKDAVTYDPIQLEVSLYEVTHDAAFGQTSTLINSSSTCTPYVADWTVTQYPTREELLGQSVLRDVIKSRRYNQELYVSPSEELGGKFTKAEGLEYGVDVDAYYYAVHILHNVKKRVNNTASEPEQREEVVVYFPETNYTAMIQFVNALDTYTASAGIFMNPIVL